MARRALLSLLTIELLGLVGVLIITPLAYSKNPTTMGPFGPLATWVITALPTLIVCQQGVMLWLVKGRSLTSRFVTRTGWRFAQVAEQTRTELSEHFDLAPIALRYAAPAILLFALAHCEARALFDVRHCNPPICDGWEAAPLQEALRGARYGAAGAYTYVMLTLGQRTFRRDVTVGLSIWCVVTLVTGPLLGAVLARMWQLGAGPANGWERPALFFVAGLSPRAVTAWIKQTVEQLWMGRKDVSSNPARALPLTNIRGIDSQEAERMAEEGIFDAAGLALASPHRLLRNTPFDLRQIVGWMDEAMLMFSLPKDWEALENVGITGAVDLAWHADENDDGLAKLAADAQMTPKLEMLKRTSQRLAEDAQLQLLWTLWQAGGPDDKDEGMAPSSR